MHATEFRTKRERALFRVCFALSALAWLVLVITIVGLLYGPMVGLFIFAAHALMIAYVKGHGVRVSQDQFPTLYGKVTHAAEKLGLDRVPEVYVLQAGGMLNAFATRLLGRPFVILYSDLLEACDEGDREIDMILGHEIAHLALGHLKWRVFLLPARLVPLLGQAYSRACEYSCDRCGLEVVEDLKAAARGLAVLAAGGKYGKRVDLSVFALQVGEIRGFWASVYELNASHPYLTKRVAALINARQPGAIRVPGRDLLAYPLAPAFSFAVQGGGTAPLIVIVALGVMAAVAIPQFQQYVARSTELTRGEQFTQMDLHLNRAHRLASEYKMEHGTWPCGVEALDVPDLVAVAQANGWEVELNCEHGYCAVFYPNGLGTDYRAIHFESGEIEAGTISE